MNQLSKSSLLLAITILASACGGGGGSNRRSTASCIEDACGLFIERAKECVVRPNQDEQYIEDYLYGLRNDCIDNSTFNRITLNQCEANEDIFATASCAELF